MLKKHKMCFAKDSNIFENEAPENPITKGLWGSGDELLMPSNKFKDENYSSSTRITFDDPEWDSRTTVESILKPRKKIFSKNTKMMNFQKSTKSVSFNAMCTADDKSTSKINFIEGRQKEYVQSHKFVFLFK